MAFPAPCLQIVRTNIVGRAEQKCGFRLMVVDKSEQEFVVALIRGAIPLLPQFMQRLVGIKRGTLVDNPLYQIEGKGGMYAISAAVAKTAEPYPCAFERIHFCSYLIENARRQILSGRDIWVLCSYEKCLFHHLRRFTVVANDIDALLSGVIYALSVYTVDDGTVFCSIHVVNSRSHFTI